MDNYIALIRRADFIDLFKYGYIHLNKDMIRCFTCPVEALSKKKVIFNDLMYFANNFESSFSYLFIHYSKILGRCNDVDISEVQHIYPLDYEAKKELSISFDSRIKIEDPLWPNEILEFQKQQTILSCLKGVDNLWKIYNITDEKEDIKNNYITYSILKEVIDELYQDVRPLGNLPVWIYAMRYQRHAYYPPNIIGCFMDAVHVIMNYMQKQEIGAELIENTNIMKFLLHLNSLNETISYVEVLDNLKKEESVSKILEYSNEIEPNIDLIKCLTLFFIYHNRYKNAFVYEENWVDYGKRYGKEFHIAIYMLGCILQHKHTYDCFYNTLPLSIFKQKEIVKLNLDPNQKTINEPKVDKKETLTNCDNQKEVREIQCSLFEPEGCHQLPVPIILKKTSRSKKDIVTAYTEDEYNEYLSRGYKKFNSNKTTNK